MAGRDHIKQAGSHSAAAIVGDVLSLVQSRTRARLSLHGAARARPVTAMEDNARTGVDSPIAKGMPAAGAASSAASGTGTNTPLGALPGGGGGAHRGHVATDSGSIFDGMTPGSEPGSGQKPKGSLGAGHQRRPRCAGSSAVQRPAC